MKKLLFIMALGAALFTSCNKEQSVALNESLVRLSIGDSMTLSASVEGSSKNKLTWKSSNTGVASVEDFFFCGEPIYLTLSARNLQNHDRPPRVSETSLFLGRFGQSDDGSRIIILAY